MNDHSATEGFAELADRDELIDDPARIEQYRAVGLAEGLQKGSESEVLWAWQWLSDHPAITNGLQETVIPALSCQLLWNRCALKLKTPCGQV